MALGVSIARASGGGCGVAPQVVSLAPALGNVVLLPSLAEVQGRDFDQPTILICESLGGNEDIPVTPRCSYYAAS